MADVENNYKLLLLAKSWKIVIFEKLETNFQAFESVLLPNSFSGNKNMYTRCIKEIQS